MNRNRKRGFAFEYRILNTLKRQKGKGVLEVLRSGGSHSLFDVIAFTNRGVRLIQAKMDGYLKREEREGMIEFLKSVDEQFLKCIQLELWYYVSKRKRKKAILKVFGDTNLEKAFEKIKSFNKKIKR